jgi:oxalate decarboxylase
MSAAEPVRDGEGADIVGPRNAERERQDPFTVRPPTSDHGTMPNLKWSFADSHIRIEEGGWARETTIRELPISKAMSGVNMRLKAGAVRELHWHKEAEWSYMLKGKARITAVDEVGRTFADDVCEGDLWYFPPGIPHSIQGLDSEVDGCEFLLVFDERALCQPLAQPVARADAARLGRGPSEDRPRGRCRTVDGEGARAAEMTSLRKDIEWTI